DGIESHIDQFYANSWYGCGVPDDWSIWQAEQVAKADFVLLVYTPGYRQKVDHQRESGSYRDVALMLQELDNGRSRQRFIPVGYGHYGDNAAHIQDFLAGAHYYNLESPENSSSLVRRLRGTSRTDIFISYSHENQASLDELLKTLGPVRDTLKLWTD